MKPRIAWTVQVSSLQSRNNVLFSTDRLFFGTSGSEWNVSDELDGVRCVDSATGKILWFAPTDSDVNEIALLAGTLIAPCDSGSIYGINPETGNQLWVRKLPGRVLAKPMRAATLRDDSALLITHSGEMLELNVRDGFFSKIAHLHQEVRANPIVISSDPLGSLLIATEAGMLLKFDMLYRRTTRLAFADYAPFSSAESARATGVIHSSPAVAATSAVFGFARDTYYDGAALTCINMADGTIRWTEPTAKNRYFGNCRSIPLICENKVVCAFAYSKGLDIFDLNSGQYLSSVAVGQEVFQQWSSPVEVAPGLIAISRVDGVVSFVDVHSLKLIASVSISTALGENTVVDMNKLRTDSTTFDLLPGEPPRGGICMTPLYHRGSLYVGDTNGTLAKIDLRLS